MGSVDLSRLKVQIAGNFQHFTGKPWAASTQVTLPQGDQRILLEPPGSRRLPSQTLLDLRVARPVTVGRARLDLMVDVLNVLNESAAEALATDNRFSATFGQPTVFVNPRRAMLSVRFSVGG
jgi:hypothetical protein